MQSATHKTKRLLSLLLTLAMVCSLFASMPLVVGAAAVGQDGPPAGITEEDEYYVLTGYLYDTGDLHELDSDWPFIPYSDFPPLEGAAVYFWYEGEPEQHVTDTDGNGMYRIYLPKEEFDAKPQESTWVNFRFDKEGYGTFSPTMSIFDLLDYPERLGHFSLQQVGHIRINFDPNHLPADTVYPINTVRVYVALYREDAGGEFVLDDHYSDSWTEEFITRYPAFRLDVRAGRYKLAFGYGNSGYSINPATDIFQWYDGIIEIETFAYTPIISTVTWEGDRAHAGDLVSPFILSVKPAGADNPDFGFVTISFNEEMRTDIKGTVILKNAAGAETVLSGLGDPNGNWSEDKKVFSVPYDSLEAGRYYTIHIADFQDAANNLMITENRLFSFSVTGGYAETTFPPSETGVVVTGNFTPDAEVTDVLNAAHALGTDDACDAIHDAEGKGLQLALHDITVSKGSFTGPITLTIPVGMEHEGKVVSVLHCDSGTLETISAVVQDGKVTFTLTSLSPIGIVLAEPPAPGTAWEFEVNTSSPTIVSFGGKQWAVIGYDGVGNTTPNDTLTLLLANGQSYGTSYYSSSGYIGGHEYSDSILRGKMDDAYNSLPAKEWDLVATRTLTGGGGFIEHADYDSDLIAGPDVTGAGFWPLSVYEAERTNSSTRVFSGRWWLRSPGFAEAGFFGAPIVNDNGNINDRGAMSDYNLYDVRSAFYLDLSSVIVTSEAKDGKFGATVGGGLMAATAPTGAVKFTAISDYNASTNPEGLSLTCTDVAKRTVKSGDTVNIIYSGATTGANNYVSCVIEDSSGVLFYGKLADTASGTASFTVPTAVNLPQGDYTIKLFSEEANTDNYTDFCSTPVLIPLTVDNTAPTVTDVTPSGTGAATSENVVITFNEAMDTATTGTVQLNSLAALSGGTWSDGDTKFTIAYSGLANSTSYTVNISGFKDAAGNTIIADGNNSFTTVAPPPNALAGTATISNTSPRIGDTLNGSLVGGNNTGTLTYTWKSGSTILSTGAAYTVLAADLGNTITLEITSSVETGTRTSAATSAVAKKTAPAAPAAPTVSGAPMAISITLNTISGAEYSQGSTGVWQDSPTFSSLSPNTGYTFYARIKETADTLPSAISPASATITTAKATLGGTVAISGTAKFGETLTANTTGLTSSPAIGALGTLSYQWQRGGSNIAGATNSTYTLVAADTGQTITVTVTAANCDGSRTSAATATVAKADGPVISGSVTGSYTGDGATFTYTVNAVAGAEYSKDGINYQSSNVFTGFTTTSPAATFYARIAETTTAEAGVPKNTGAVTFSLLANSSVPTLDYEVTGVSGSKTITINAVTGAEYQFGTDGYGSARTKTYAADVTETIYIRYAATATHNASTAASTIVDLTNEEQSAPPAFTLTFMINPDGATYTATIPVVTGGEYSFDGVTFSSTNTKTDCAANTSYSGYARLAAKAGYNASPVTGDTKTAPKLTVTTPIISPASTTFTSSQTITITCVTAGVSIYYTTDGSTPTAASVPYTAPFNVTAATTVRAIAVRADMNDSAIAAATYTLSTGTGGGGGGGTPSTNASLNTTKADFDKDSGKDISVTLTKGSYTLSAVKNGSYTLKECTDYTVSGNTYTIKASYLDTLTVGSQAITFDMNGGTDPTLTVTVNPKTITPVLPVNPFEDVKGTDWFIDDVIYVYDKGLMNGTSTSPMLFSPNATLTRGMVVTVLWRLRGEPMLADYENTFSDVNWQEYYFNAVQWASASKIVTGYGEGEFGPNNPITRQDLAVILARYMDYMEINLPVTEQFILFADANDISGYAMSAIQTFNKLGIINGTGTNAAGQTIINPKGNATRAEAAAMFHRFLEAIEE